MLCPPPKWRRNGLQKTSVFWLPLGHKIDENAQKGRSRKHTKKHPHKDTAKCQNAPKTSKNLDQIQTFFDTVFWTQNATAPRWAPDPKKPPKYYSKACFVRQFPEGFPMPWAFRCLGHPTSTYFACPWWPKRNSFLRIFIGQVL